ncbi:eosinophil peroxidase-like [Suncus etruscus]|uniref:eosinophil peroxidase-like n=1 Tax=Suncus etruscus TaxID=109475 RepID=UPI00210FC3C6|nr:eosinophil peroxidase-like [Suncus etruscus]
MILTQPCEGLLVGTTSVLHANNAEGGQLVDASYDGTEKSIKQEHPGDSVRPIDHKQPVVLELSQEEQLEQGPNSVRVAGDMMTSPARSLSPANECADQNQDEKQDQDQDGDEQCSDQYQTITGRCNNRRRPWLGSSNQALARWLPAVYEDGRGLPLGWTPGKKHNGFALPLVRDVSNVITGFPTAKLTSDLGRTLMVPQWGQFIIQDLVFSPEFLGDNDFHMSDSSERDSTGIDADCHTTCARKPPCFPIEVPPSDPRSKSIGDCLPFFRSTSAPSNNRSHVREQLNVPTSFLDASMLYGSYNFMAQRLRNLTDPSGLLAINQVFRDQGRALLPFDNVFPDPCQLTNRSANIPCFLAGDSRASETLEMMALHTLFLREHNRLVMELKRLNPHWFGEQLYQEARKIVGAMIQIITYRDFLRILLGPVHYARYLGSYQGYCYKEDPRVANVFTMVSRFSHTMMQPFVPRLDSQYRASSPTSQVALSNAFFATWRVVHEGGIDPILRGLIATPAKRNQQNAMVVDELRERLFERVSRVGQDLVAINLQQGRDHGIPGYNAWRGYCGLSQPKTLAELSVVLKNPNLARKFMKLYGTPDNIDLWIGAIAEPFVKGGRVGPLLACLLGKQFRKIRSGDRFWWEKPGIFTERQREELHRISLSAIICDNTGIATGVQRCFRNAKHPEQFVSCRDIPRMNLSYWQGQ